MPIFRCRCAALDPKPSFGRYDEFKVDPLLDPLDVAILSQLEAYRLLERSPSPVASPTPSRTTLPAFDATVTQTEAVRPVPAAIGPESPPESLVVEPFADSSSERIPRTLPAVPRLASIENVPDTHAFATGGFPSSFCYSFSSLGHHAMLLLPETDIIDTRPLYHISWREEFWAPGTIVTVRRGGSENGQRVGHFR